jgi:large subunit ribosomal protein L18
MKTLANKSQEKNRTYARRKHRTNVIAKTTSDRARLVINRSNVHIYAQVINTAGVVVATANDMTIITGTKSERAYQVGEAIAKAAIANKVTTVVFDRNGFLFHGRVKQLADGARNAGLVF